MTGDFFKSWLKQHSPAAVNLARKMRALTEPAPIDTVVLNDYRFSPEKEIGRRLNIVVPGLDPASAFGGINTCVAFMLQLTVLLRKSGEVELRFLTERADSIENTVVPGIAAAAGLGLEGVTVQSAPRGAVLSVRRRDLFVAYNWWTSLNIQSVIEEQCRFYAIQPLPKFHFFQEYEPQFYPFSSAHMLARQALDADWPLHVIFNTQELMDYTLLMGHRFEGSYVFEPNLNPALLKHLDGIRHDEKEKQILVYARPGIPRNCYSIIERGLTIWADTDAATNWRLISAGSSHKPVALPRGHVMKSLGKLSIDEYGQLLRKTAVGISLMSSPHPSYPPLEMAHFGVHVVSNDYTCKSIASRHENISTLNDMRPEAFARAVSAACARFDHDPTAALKTRSYMPDFLSNRADALPLVAATLSRLWASV